MCARVCAWEGGERKCVCVLFHTITDTQGLQVDKQMGIIGINVVRSMLPKGTSMSNPYKWRKWASMESTPGGKDKIKWKAHASNGRPRLETIDGVRKWMEDVPRGAAVDYAFVKARLKQNKKVIS